MHWRRHFTQLDPFAITALIATTMSCAASRFMGLVNCQRLITSFAITSRGATSMMPALLTSDFRIASLSSCLALKRLLWRQQFVTFKFLDLRRSSLPSRAEFCAGGNRDRGTFAFHITWIAPGPPSARGLFRVPKIGVSGYCCEAGARRTRFLPCRSSRRPRPHAPERFRARYTARDPGRYCSCPVAHGLA